MTFFVVADAKKFDSSTSECHQLLSPWQLNWYFSCAKKVESISDHAGHEGIVVDYRCINRFYVKDVKLDKPFHVVRVEWLKDYPPHVLGGSSTQTRQDHLEREVWQVLSSVAAITAKLESASSKSEVMKSSKVLYNWLPAQVRQFAPLPSWTRPTFAPNQHVAKGRYQIPPVFVVEGNQELLSNIILKLTKNSLFLNCRCCNLEAEQFEHCW